MKNSPLKNGSTLPQTVIFFLVKLGFKDSSVAAKIIRGRKIIENMTGNPYFTTPIPTLNDFSKLVDNLEAAEAAMDGSKIKTEQRNNTLQLFEAGIKQLQSYVEVTANGNTEQILSSGFEVRNPATKPQILPAPTIMKVYSNGQIGQLVVKCKSIKGCKLYVFEICTDLNKGDWMEAGASTKAGITIEKLQSGTLYYIRAIAINAAGISPASDMGTCRPA
jgi:hypothetical protein